MKNFVIPSIDILDGQIVRLFKGNYGEKTVYNVEISELIAKYQDFERLHIVDLNGAKGNGIENLAIIKEIREKFHGKIQLGGGIRNLEIAQSVLALGVDAVVLGTVAITDFELTKEVIAKLGGENVILAIDCKLENGKYFPKSNGWLEGGKLDLFEIITQYELIASEILVTDISVDGTMQGANLELYRQIKSQFPQLKLQASGGVSCLDDLKKLREITDFAIVGKALYEGIIKSL